MWYLIVVPVEEMGGKIKVTCGVTSLDEAVREADEVNQMFRHVNHPAMVAVISEEDRVLMNLALPDYSY